MNFQINPTFDNTITDFNKTFSASVQNAQNSLKAGLNFDEVFNSVEENSKTKQKTSAIDSLIEESPKKQLSPTAKLASDIGSGISGGLDELNDIQRQSEDDIETFASGGDISIHQVMISAQKSQLSMQMAIQLRSQMLNAYNEFKNMSI